jgi:carbohydrate kinase (thermoresistant glucokinase family)
VPVTTIIIIMGVAGSGKTTVGRALAQRLGWSFVDADDLHPPANIERLRHNIPLEDGDREPWLRQIRHVIEESSARDARLVIACSALKERYRRKLAHGISGVRFVFLTGPPALLRERLERRADHVAGPALLESQLVDLEPPRSALTLDVSLPVDAIVDRIVVDLDQRER